MRRTQASVSSAICTYEERVKPERIAAVLGVNAMRMEEMERQMAVGRASADDERSCGKSITTRIAKR